MWSSLIKGLCLGSVAHALGFIMDITISKFSFDEIIKEIPLLYQKALHKIQMNMLVISPIVYTLTDQYLIDHTTNRIQIKNIMTILTIHGVGYYSVHRAMHQIQFLRKYHYFHHLFDKHIMPSIGNAVSIEEFLIAYITPFIIGAYVTTPSEISFVIPITLISIFNNIIHCRELENVYWYKYFVSPKQHIMHHQVRDKHYAAPILNLDYFIENDN